uniref:Uncharacterized protein n=1 Tax=Romanomermis culicivorax TaxID=13658 RepID=A0A915IDX6_ROMCU
QIARPTIYNRFEQRYDEGKPEEKCGGISTEDQPGIQIMHIGNKVTIMLIGKQPAVPVKSSTVSTTADDQSEQGKIVNLTASMNLHTHLNLAEKWLPELIKDKPRRFPGLSLRDEIPKATILAFSSGNSKQTANKSSRKEEMYKTKRKEEKVNENQETEIRKKVKNKKL